MAKSKEAVKSHYLPVEERIQIKRERKFFLI